MPVTWNMCILTTLTCIVTVQRGVTCVQWVQPSVTTVATRGFLVPSARVEDVVLITLCKGCRFVSQRTVSVPINRTIQCHGPLTRYVKLRFAHAPGIPETFSPRVSDPGMHHGTCVTHVPRCMPGSLTSGFHLISVAGKTFPAFPSHAQPAICVSGKRPMHKLCNYWNIPDNQDSSMVYNALAPCVVMPSNEG